MTGIFGVVSVEECSKILFYGTDYHSHLGTQRGGMVTLRSDGSFDRKIHDITTGQFKSKFHRDYKSMSGRMGIGVISDTNPQPLRIGAKFNSEIENYAIVTAGRIVNDYKLADELCMTGDSFSEMTNDNSLNMTEIIAKIINREDTKVKGIQKVFEKIDGSCSILILSKEGIYAARDFHGRSALVLGKRVNDWAVASETISFANLGFQTHRFLKPGEIVLINNSGVHTLVEGDDSRTKMCAFMWVYTGNPGSYYEGINAESVRYRIGGILAEYDVGLEYDLVGGIPDSGSAYSFGYVNKKIEMAWDKIKSDIERNPFGMRETLNKIKPPLYGRPIIKYTDGYGRSYVPPTQEKRDEVARMKTLVIGDILTEGWNEITREKIKGKRIILTDDSIVRGTQFRKLIDKVWSYGAKEIHLRVACPPLLEPCKYLVSTKKRSELIGRRAIIALEGKDLENINEYLDHTSEKYKNMVEWIKNDLGVTSLKYVNINDMARAIGLEKNKLCLDCWGIQTKNI